MPFSSTTELPESVRGRLSEDEQRQWLAVFNQVFADTGDESRAFAAANGAVSKSWSRDIEIIEKNHDQQQVFGFLSVSVDKDGNLVEDLQNDMITPDELEKGAYNYVRMQGVHKTAGEMHTNIGVGDLIESMVFTKAKQEALGIPAGILPECAYWIGYQITDDNVWKRVKSGELTAFSIGGRAIRETI